MYFPERYVHENSRKHNLYEEHKRAARVSRAFSFIREGMT